MAYGRVNKTGCTVRKGNCQIRLDFYLESTDPRYADRHLYLVDTTSAEYLAGYRGEVDEHGIPKDQAAYDAWLDSLPHVWQNTPLHSHFIYLPADFTEEDIKAEIDIHLANFYQAFQERWDEVAGGMRHGWATDTRIGPTDYSKMESETEYDTKVADCQLAVDSLVEFSYKAKGSTTGETFAATEIDLGSAATDRASTFNALYTIVDVANPANNTGTIDSFEIWANVDQDGTNKVGTFYGSGTDYTNRDGQAIGTVTAGAKRTFSGLDIDVSSGDFAGMYWNSGKLERDLASGSGIYYKAQDQFGTGQQTYVLRSDDAISLYGTGETAGWTNISHDKGVLASAMAYKKGVAVADISHVKGVAV